MKIMMERSGSSLWNEIIYIQGLVPWSHELKDMRVILFIAPIDFDNPDIEILYDLNQFDEDEILLKKNISLYCLKQCYKIAYYLSKEKNIVK